MSSFPAVYTKSAAYFHWIVGVPLMGCVGTVLKAQQAPKEEKGTWMYRHKSLGLLTGMLVAPRFAYRFYARSKYAVVGPVEGSSSLEHMAANVSHFGLYAFMGIMPLSGVLMGYFGGKGLPFFGTTFKGIESTDETKARNGAIAKQSFNIHKQVGTYGKYLIPLHIAGAFKHSLSGHAIFYRINPFRGPPKH